MYDVLNHQLSVDCADSSLNPDTARDQKSIKLDFTDKLELRIFLDASTLEIFADGRSISTRIYPSRSDSLGVLALAEGGQAVLESFEAWQMRSFWGQP